MTKEEEKVFEEILTQYMALAELRDFWRNRMMDAGADIVVYRKLQKENGLHKNK